MKFEIIFNDDARDQFRILERTKARRAIFKAVCKTLVYMETDLRHPSLNTHEFSTLKGPNSEKVFESYVQNKTPGAYRLFWYYGPNKKQITVVAIVPHP